MSYFELSLLAGLGVGGLLGSQLWRTLASGAFVAIALIYVCAAALLFAGGTGSHAHRARRQCYNTRILLCDYFWS